MVILLSPPLKPVQSQLNRYPPRSATINAIAGTPAPTMTANLAGCRFIFCRNERSLATIVLTFYILGMSLSWKAEGYLLQVSIADVAPQCIQRRSMMKLAIPLVKHYAASYNHATFITCN